MVLIPIGAFVVENSLIFYLEALGVWAFAVSWIVKSQAEQALAERLRKRWAKQDPSSE